MTDRDGAAERRDRVNGLFDAKQHHGHRPAAGARERLARAAWHTCRNVCRVNEPIFFTHLLLSASTPSTNSSHTFLLFLRVHERTRTNEDLLNCREHLIHGVADTVNLRTGRRIRLQSGRPGLEACTEGVSGGVR